MVNAAQAEYPAQRFFLLFFQVVSLDMYAFLQQWDMAVIMLQIVAIDLLLGGDNAVVIAMACRKLPPQKRTKAIIIGTVGAILARVLLLAIALYLLSLPWLIGGAVVVENVFAWPGMGQLIWKAISKQDFVIIQGVVLVITILTVICNLIGDILAGILDPRIRLE